MQNQCPHCGHALWGSGHAEHRQGVAADPAASIVPDIGVGQSGAGQSAARHDDVDDADERLSKMSRAGSGRRWLVGAGIAAFVGFVAVFFCRSGDDPIAADEPPSAIDRAIADAAPDGSGGTDGSSSTVGGDPNFPPSDDHLAADRIADVFRLSVDDEQQYAVVYPSQQGLQILSAAGANIPALEVAVGFEEAVRFPLLSDGNRTWAVNPEDQDTVFLVSTQFVVVDVGLEGSVAFINPSIEPTNVGISSFGAWGPGFNVPSDADILPVPGRGLLIVPATGGTFKLTQSGVEQISDDRVVAAGLSSEIYQRCDETLECELYVTGLDNADGTALDVDAASDVFVSPLGRHVLASTPEGIARITRIDSGDEWDVSSDGVAAVGWSPDGRFVAFVSGDDMVLAFPGEQRIERMTLPILPASEALLVVAQ